MQTTPSTLSNEEKIKFVTQNFSWLEKWLDSSTNYFKTIEYEFAHICRASLQKQIEGFQLFKHYSIRGSMNESEWKWIIDQKFEEHKKEIIFASVLSIKKDITSPRHFEKLWTMSGFIEQVGRLPNKNDKVRFVFYGDDTKGNRFLRIMINEENNMAEILTDCKLEIL